MSVAAFDQRAQRLALAHDVLGRAEAKTALASAPLSSPGAREGERRLSVPAPLAPILPDAGLRAGSSVGIAGACATSFALSLAQAAMGEDSWCALVGMPHVGLSCLQDLGIDTDRIALVPELGTQAGTVLSALVDGIDVLVLGSDLALTAGAWRAVSARARTQGTLLLRVRGAESSSGASGDSCDLDLSSSHVAWNGLAQGSGRLRSRTVRASSRGRGVAPGQKAIEVRMPAVTGALAAVPAPAATPATSGNLTALPTPGPDRGAGESRRGLSLVREAG